MLTSPPLILAMLLTLKHYGIAFRPQKNNMDHQNLNGLCGRSLNRSKYVDHGTINVNFTELSQLSAQYPLTLPFQCNFTIRANRSALLFWYDISEEFKGDMGNCSVSKNIIKVVIGCYAPTVYCLTNHKQKAYELLAPDGCFDIQLSTIVKGFVFSAAFGYSSLQDEFVPYNNYSSHQFISNYLVVIIIVPVVLLIAVIGITFAMMRQAQHSCMVDTLQSHQKLIYYQQQASTSSEADPNWQSDKSSISLFDDEPTSRRYSNPKRVSYVPNRSLKALTTSEYRSSRSYSAGEAAIQRQVSGTEPENVVPSYDYNNTMQQSSQHNVEHGRLDFLTLNDDGFQQQQTNFIENPLGELLEVGVDEHSPALRSSLITCTPGPSNLISLQDHDDQTKRASKYSRLSRLSSIDSLFDQNLMIDCDNEDHNECMAIETKRNDSILVRTESSDSYFDKM